MTRKVLIFPALLLESVRLKIKAAERGETVVAASSDAGEAALRLFPSSAVLPHIADPAFPEALRALIAREAIAHIYAPHDGCARAMRDLLAAWGLPIMVSNESWQSKSAPAHDALRAEVEPVHAAYAARAMRRPIISLDHLTAFLTAITPVAGQSHFLKLATLGALAADCPEGDIVEIGVAAGRSAIFLTLLARHFKLGKLLCVDPWRHADALQNIGTLDARASADEESWNYGMRAFMLNMLPFAQGDVGFLRMPSAEGHARYVKSRTLGAPPLGPVATTGKIGLLHIDGNHDFPKVAEDLALWTPHLLPGAWMIIDDYEWPYGDGPRRAADAWLAQNAARVAESRVAGHAMFVKLR